MSRIFGPRPACVATRWPARLNGAPSTHVVLNPSASNSARKNVADLPDAGEVVGAAVDVDGALEQRQRLVVVRVDPCRDGALVSRARLWQRYEKDETDDRQSSA